MFQNIWKASKANTFLEQSLGYVTGDRSGAMRVMRGLAKEFPQQEPAELAFSYLIRMHTGEIGSQIAEIAGTTDEDRFSTLRGIRRQLIEAQKNEFISFDVYNELYEQLSEDTSSIAEKLDPD